MTQPLCHTQLWQKKEQVGNSWSSSTTALAFHKPCPTRSWWVAPLLPRLKRVIFICTRLRQEPWLAKQHCQLNPLPALTSHNPNLKWKHAGCREQNNSSNSCFPLWNLPNLCFRQLNLPMETPLPRWHQLIGTLCGVIRIESQTFWRRVGTWSCQSCSLGCRSTSCGPAGAAMSLGCRSIMCLVCRDAWRLVCWIQCLLGFIPADHCADSQD